MDSDSSTKFIGSLTKFLQSLCNGYVEFQKGVELVGHIYLSIDTGEKVDYILHEKVNKNDENSVSFVSNSFHALPLEKNKAPANKETPANSGTGARDLDLSDDDDIMIMDPMKVLPGSSNSGSLPSRGVKRVASPHSSQRPAHRPHHAGQLPVSARNQGSSSSSHQMSSPGAFGNRQHIGPTATVTSQANTRQDNLSISDVKLEQITSDELMSLASHVNEGRSGPSQMLSPAARSHSQSHRPTGGGSMWIKQEAGDDDGGGSDAGWSQEKDDSNSNSGSNLYPVMLHQNPAGFSGPVFPGFSGANSSGHQAAANLFADPLPGTSQDASGLDPSEGEDLRRLRTFYSPQQALALEEEFQANMYLSPQRRRQVGLALNLSDRQLKIWFQNRRMKWKKEHKLTHITKTMDLNKLVFDKAAEHDKGQHDNLGGV